MIIHELENIKLNELDLKRIINQKLAKLILEENDE